MLLAILLMVTTLAVVASVVLPLVRTARPAPTRAAFDRAVYRAQLDDLERDVARGVIDRQDASTTKLEIERRLIASDSQKAAPPAQPVSPILAVGLALAMPAVAALIYLAHGSPGVPDHPYTAPTAEAAAAGGSTAPGHIDFAAAATRLEQDLKEHPEDAEKWLLLARTLAEIGNWQKSADAYHRVIELTGGDADIFAGYAEMLVMDAQGIVTPAARSAFESALKQSSSHMVARFYLALGDAQAGNAQQAIDGWQKLAAELPANSNIREEIKRRVEEAARSAGLPTPAFPPPAQAAAEPAPGTSGAPVSAPGPSAEDMAAAQSMSADDRQAMIRSMVARLADRLKSEPNDLDGWMRLGRAYGVLGERDKAIDAYEHADGLLPAGSDQHREIATAIAALKTK